jgi:magnesium chelatase family protein
MVARVRTVAFQGIDVLAVDAEVQIAQGLPAFNVVGLPDKAVRESRERVHAALTAIGLGVPPKRITVNLAPADLAKEGSHYDLPIALAMLIAMGAIESDAVASFAVLGELGLDGRINAVSGVLPAAIHAASDALGLICPAAQGGEAAWAGEIDVVATRSHRAHQSSQGHAGLERARAPHGGAERARARPEGHQGPGDREARA